MTLGISIHSLREEGDGLYSGSYSGIVSISIHSLREEGDLLKYATLGASEISIHSLREEGDTRWGDYETKSILFQSTPSARRETLFKILPT